MNKMKKSIRIALIISTAAIALIFVVNISDSNLNAQTTEVLDTALNPNDLDEKKCAAALGLFVDPALDSLGEGTKLLETLKNLSAEKTAAINEVAIPHELENITPKEKCNGFCLYDKPEKERLKEALRLQQVYLARFKSLVEMGDVQCHHPQVLLKLPILSLFRLAKHQILEYTLLAQEGKMTQATSGLVKMNRFLEKTLLREKYTLVTSSIYTTLLIQVRQTLLSLPSLKKDKLPPFEILKYEELVKRIEVGELQVSKTLIQPPLDYRFFEMTDINNTTTPEPPAWAPVASALMNYFFQKQATLNAKLETLRASAWHPCIGQKDIPCDSKSANYLTWIRNPVGKSITQILTDQMPTSFQKLKNKVETLNQLATPQQTGS